MLCACLCVSLTIVLFNYPSLTCIIRQHNTVGLLAKPTHGNIIRFAPPLVINDSEVRLLLDSCLQYCCILVCLSRCTYVSLFNFDLFLTQMDQALEILKKSLQPL